MPIEAGPVVFVITRGDSVGGAQIHVRDLATRLKTDGDDVLVLVGNPGAFTRDLDSRGISWRTCPGLARSINPLQDIQAVREVHRALLRVRPRLLSTHTAKAGMVGRIAGAWAGIPVVFTVHGWQFAPGIPRAQRALVYTLELILSRLPVPQRVIAVSRYDLRLARSSAAVPRRRLRLVYNGLPDAAGPQGDQVTSDDAWDRNPVVRVTMVARFQAQKDHATLLRAMAGVSGAWVLRLVGEAGPLLAATRALAHELGFQVGETARTGHERRVEFLGHRDDVAKILGDSDLYCLISNWEGLPRSIIEAMRAGLPVVASDVGGVRELVRDRETGRVVPRGDTKRLTAVLEEMIGNRQARVRMGSAGRTRYEGHFTFEAMYRNSRHIWTELGCVAPCAVRAQDGE